MPKTKMYKKSKNSNYLLYAQEPIFRKIFKSVLVSFLSVGEDDENINEKFLPTLDRPWSSAMNYLKNFQKKPIVAFCHDLYCLVLSLS